MVTVSSHNPFRVQPLSPAATGNSINPPPSFHTVAGDDETTLNPLLPDLPSIPEAADQERDLPPIPTEERERNRARQPPRSPVITLDLPPPIHEEQPPAYTATPDIRHGESTLDLGPRRPFQQPRSTRSAASSPRPAQAGLTPSYTGPTAASSSSNFLTPSLTGTPFVQRRRNGHRPGLIQQLAGSLVDQLQNAAFGPSAGDGSVAQSSQGATSAPRHARSFSSFTPSPGPSTSPPPLPPRQTPSAPRLSSNSSGSRDTSPNTISRSTTSTTARSAAVSDFARDFYAAGTADVLIRVDSDLSSDDHHSRNQPRVVDGDISLELRMSSPRSNPRRRNSFDASQIATSSLEPHLQLQPSNSSPSLGTVDDSKPTSIPVPGHPLLRGGKLLVYPKGHTCSKCTSLSLVR
ncbi:hypothetical protein APHAL10511_000725 [Amanita phalloides]|nr:hypothetical protein APHAL10511_000725 [Amanita phalloides]